MEHVFFYAPNPTWFIKLGSFVNEFERRVHVVFCTMPVKRPVDSCCIFSKGVDDVYASETVPTDKVLRDEALLNIVKKALKRYASLPVNCGDTHTVYREYVHVEKLQVTHKFMDDLMSDIAMQKQRHAVASKIQRAWRNASYNPQYQICMNRLRFEFHELSTYSLHHSTQTLSRLPPPITSQVQEI